MDLQPGYYVVQSGSRQEIAKVTETKTMLCMGTNIHFQREAFEDGRCWVVSGPFTIEQAIALGPKWVEVS